MSKTIVLFSTKGGVGKTLIATNLAIALAKDKTKPVCIIDLDLEVVGDMARMLGLKPQKTLVAFLHHLKNKREDSEVKKDDFLTRYSEGLDFLPGVPKPQFSPHFDTGCLKDVFDILKKHYEYIVVDGGQSFNDSLISALDQSNLILLVVTPDILSIYQTKWTLDTLQSLQFPLRMVKIILNRAESISSISPQEVSSVLPCEIIAMIPSEGKVAMQAVNLGKPILSSVPRSKIALSINKLAGDISTRDDLFIESTQISEMRPLVKDLQKPAGEFWVASGLTEEMQEEREVATKDDQIVNLKQQVHRRLIAELDLKKMQLVALSGQHRLKELRE
ncbi:MAG: AAA family ATPase, partial [Candidatus Omnitrophota bacterium]